MDFTISTQLKLILLEYLFNLKNQSNNEITYVIDPTFKYYF